MPQSPRQPEKRKRRSRRKPVHRGLHYSRVTSGHNPREKAFADLWEKECERHPGYGYGFGILQDLMFVRAEDQSRALCPMFHPNGKFEFTIDQRDATIVATIVQWLGSNCGMGFIEMALRKCGYRLTKETHA